MEQSQFLDTEVKVSYSIVDGDIIVNSADLYINGAFISITEKVKDELEKMLN